MKTAVVILNWNGAELLKRFLPSVVAHTQGEDVSVVVADNASTDSSLTVLHEEFPMVRVIVLDKNYGFAEGYNRALAQIVADYFVLLNSDVAVDEGWLRPLTDHLDTHEDVAIVQPKILKYGDEGPTSTFEYAGASGGFIDKYGYPYCRGRVMDTVEEDAGQYDAPMEIHWATGACLAVRATDYKAVGGMDARFFAHQEEIDLCWRLRIRGKRIFCLPQSRVWHVGGASLPQGNPRKTYLNFRNNLTTIYKNMPSSRLSSVLRMRKFLDHVAALRAFLTGNLTEARAILRARKDFNANIEQFTPDRDMIQSQRQMDPTRDTTSFSLLVHYYLCRHHKWNLLPAKLLFFLLMCTASIHADDKTRGIGIYPGRPAESFAPELTLGGDVRRNLALHHSVYHSSCYDFNLTGQLTTDGIIAQGELPHLEVLVNGENLPKNTREYSIDGNQYNRNTLMGSSVTLQMKYHGMTIDVDSVVVHCTMAYHAEKATQGYAITLSDGANTLYVDTCSALPGEPLGYEIHSDPNKQTEQDLLPARVLNSGYAFTSQPLSTLCLTMEMEGAEYWTISDLSFYKEGHAVDTALLPMSHFESGWMSETGGSQWCYVDLGAESLIDEVALYWLGSAPKGCIEVSHDAENWTFLENLPEGDITYRLPVETSGRYVRVVVDGQDMPYMLSEMEVYGTGGTIFSSPPAPQHEGHTLSLNGGEWQLKRAGSDLCIPATVPATVLSSYVNVGAVQNPNYDDNIKYISESYFYSDFFYTREFSIPREMLKKRVFLHLDGINWKARLYLNDEPLGGVEGAFMRGKLDITSRLKDTNTLTIEILRPDHPGATKEKDLIYPTANGGLLGEDNPTFHASVGWDWIPTVRGREIGIWDDIYLTMEEELSLSDPLITTTLALPDTLATMTPEVCYHNLSGAPLSGTIHGWIGELSFQKDVTLASGVGTFTFHPEDYPQLYRARMRLWWPNGYGEPYLYDAGFCFVDSLSGDTLSVVEFKHGVRQMTYKDVERALTIYVNGRRIVPLGGNWGFPEQNLNFRAREYDIAVRNHRDMNFNMIRNWVAQTADREFYEACDRYGILIWQDFCLANPADGPDPDDVRLFENNALDYLLKIRHHPSIALYCGRNEGYPPKVIDDNLRQIVDLYHPGMAYISSSADDGVSGHGPYNALPAKEYFSRQTGLLHSERGMPCVMSIESLSRTMRPEHLWPQNDVWGQHDYTMLGAQRGESFNSLIASRFGEATSAEEFTRWAQLINYEGYRAMFEGSSKDRMGLLIWMSHSCWPSQSWQCYDYYFESTAAYFACRKACEPLHIQYNALTEKAEVVNIGVGDHRNLRVLTEVFSLEGKRKLKKEYKVTSRDDSTTPLPASIDTSQSVLRLSLYDRKRLLFENTYILADDLSHLSQTEVEYSVGDTIDIADGREREVKVLLENTGTQTAYLLRLNLTDEEGGQILPVWYEENYFHLMPHEKREVRIRWALEDQHTDSVNILLTGLNIKEEI